MSFIFILHIKWFPRDYEMACISEWYRNSKIKTLSTKDDCFSKISVIVLNTPLFQSL